MLFHVDMIYLSKQVKHNEDRNQFDPRKGFLQFYVNAKKICRRMPVLAQNESLLHMSFAYGPYAYTRCNIFNPFMFYEGMKPTFSGAVAPSPWR